MSVVVARTPSAVTVHARCDSCGSLSSRDAITAGAAIDRLDVDGWAISMRTSAAICPPCSGLPR